MRQEEPQTNAGQRVYHNIAAVDPVVHSPVSTVPKKVEEKTQAQQGSKEAQAGSARSEAEKIKKCLTNQGNFYYNISCIKKKTMTKTVRYVRKFQRAGDGERPV